MPASCERSQSPIFLGLNIAKSDTFRSKLSEIMAMIFFGIKHNQTDILGSAKAILPSFALFQNSYVRLQLSKYKTKSYFWVAEK